MHYEHSLTEWSVEFGNLIELSAGGDANRWRQKNVNCCRNLRERLALSGTTPRIIHVTHSHLPFSSGGYRQIPSLPGIAPMGPVGTRVVLGGSIVPSWGRNRKCTSRHPRRVHTPISPHFYFISGLSSRQLLLLPSGEYSSTAMLHRTPHATNRQATDHQTAS